jgi:hypothetical protein
MDNLLNEPKTPMVLARQLRHIEIQILKRELARLIEAAQPESVQILQDQPLSRE